MYLSKGNEHTEVQCVAKTQTLYLDLKVLFPAVKHGGGSSSAPAGQLLSVDRGGWMELNNGTESVFQVAKQSRHRSRVNLPAGGWKVWTTGHQRGARLDRGGSPLACSKK